MKTRVVQYHFIDEDVSSFSLLKNKKYIPPQILFQNKNGFYKKFFFIKSYDIVDTEIRIYMTF
jgi:hypothetical protein